MSTPAKGTLFLIPTVLAEDTASAVICRQVAEVTAHLKYFLVENARTARRYIKSIAPSQTIEELQITVIDKNSSDAELTAALKPLLAGQDAGVISEAGCPGVADPGAELARLAHQHGVKVVPLVGPSAILMGLMASGFNGQSFAFHGYLPIEKRDRILALKGLEKEMAMKDQTQIFMETPYRNKQMIEDLLQHLNKNTKLCIAANITGSNEFIKTLRVADWKGKVPDLHKQPAVFLIYKR
ncbi:SAM-dependent methyltransferase [Rufibacter glacialis]|uniref:SAM-dependent methyltransferase n=1 Tax=Rufibacter glacialis TaxID=1259555 RepID=A0A5M8QEH5_9BACT|nr:SAM-dependent methyltransferase [Rufibacter glacialis]KAA6433330.1 SAM-dependent methyltransferase [Rufibacter glacialis]GGK75349.1 S-adenosylmethionine-dependent methyltransferase [Rufibacter glacialis]